MASSGRRLCLILRVIFAEELVKESLRSLQSEGGRCRIDGLLHFDCFMLRDELNVCIFEVDPLRAVVIVAYFVQIVLLIVIHHFCVRWILSVALQRLSRDGPLEQHLSANLAVLGVGGQNDSRSKLGSDRHPSTQRTRYSGSAIHDLLHSHYRALWQIGQMLRGEIHCRAHSRLNLHFESLGETRRVLRFAPSILLRVTHIAICVQ